MKNPLGDFSPLHPNSYTVRFSIRSYDPTPLSIEPWGISLYPIPDYEYVLEADDQHGLPEFQGLDGPLHTPESASLVWIEQPITVWLSGRNSVYRFGGRETGLVWASDYPNEVNTVINDARVASILRELHARRTNSGRVFEQEFADLVTPFARSTGHYDIVLLFREYGLVQKKGGEIVLTEWGSQVSRMTISPQRP